MRVGKSVRRVGGAVAVAGLAALGLVALAQAQAPTPLKIGITEGFSGVYADLNLGEVEAAQMAIDDFGGKVLGRPDRAACGPTIRPSPTSAPRSRGAGTTSMA